VRYIRQTFQIFIICIVFFAAGTTSAEAQIKEPVSPAKSFLKSLVVPGWGELSIGGASASQGWLHLSADAVLAASLFGLNIYVDNTRENLYTHATIHTGVDVQSKDRAYELAIGRYESIYLYNDTMERLRRWRAIYPVTEEFIWEWDSNENRLDYQSMKKNADVASNQIPAVVTFMVINRLWSGFNAYLDAKNFNSQLPTVNFEPVGLRETNEIQGWAVRMNFSF
jgi:hypothetical protein